MKTHCLHFALILRQKPHRQHRLENLRASLHCYRENHYFLARETLLVYFLFHHQRYIRRHLRYRHFLRL